MRSSQKLLKNPYVEKEGDYDARLTKVNERRLDVKIKEQPHREEDHQVEEIEAPDIYLDGIHYHIMNYPVNIGLTPTSPFYVDLATYRALRVHPLTNLAFKGRHQTDTTFKSQIHAFIYIEELRVHLEELEIDRLIDLYNVLPGQPELFVNYLLARHTCDMLSVLKLSDYEIPNKFFSQCEKLPRSVMSVPVIINGKTHMDFYDFIKFNQNRKADYIKMAREQKRKEVERDCQTRLERQEKLFEKKITSLEETTIHSAAFKRHLLSIDINHAGLFVEKSLQYKPSVLENEAALKRLKSLLSDYKEQTRDRYERIKESEVVKIKGMINTDVDGYQYVDPETEEPIHSIKVDYALLQELDDFLAVAPLKKQLRQAERLATENNAVIRMVNKDYNGKSVDEILKMHNYPMEKIPESLLVGISPFSKKVVLMTDPVILDGEYTICLRELKKFWNQKKVTGRWFGMFGGTEQDNYGLNPFTGKPVKTLAYDHNLKRAINQFIANLEYHKKCITQDEIENPNFIRKRFEDDKEKEDDYNPVFLGRRRGVLGLRLYQPLGLAAITVQANRDERDMDARTEYVDDGNNNNNQPDEQVIGDTSAYGYSISSDSPLKHLQ